MKAKTPVARYPVAFVDAIPPFERNAPITLTLGAGAWDEGAAADA